MSIFDFAPDATDARRLRVVGTATPVGTLSGPSGAETTYLAGIEVEKGFGVTSTVTSGTATLTVTSAVETTEVETATLVASASGFKLNYDIPFPTSSEKIRVECKAVDEQRGECSAGGSAVTGTMRKFAVPVATAASNGTQGGAGNSASSTKTGMGIVICAVIGTLLVV